MRETNIRTGGMWRWGVLLTLFLLTFFTVPAVPAAADEARVVIAAGDSPALGPKDAPVTIIKFTDYQ